MTGLFRAAISESGTALLTWAFHPPPEIRSMVSALAELSGCPADSVGLVECLRTRPAAYLVALFDVEYKVTPSKSYVCYRDNLPRLPIKSLVLLGGHWL